MNRFLSILSLFLLFSVAAMGQAVDSSLVAYRLNEKINFDGWVDEEVWKKITPFNLRMQLPIENGDPSELSEIRLAYDEDYLYLSGILTDSEPDKMLANTKKRDALTGATQWFGLVIDSYNDNENALAFFTTPTGLRWDMAVAGDAGGSNATNIDWNSFWDVEVQRYEEGWQAEMRIPFSTLAFDDQDGEVTMGITTWRYIGRKNELDMSPFIPATFGDWSAFKPSFAQDMVFTGLRSKKPFYVTPYVLGGIANQWDLNDTETGYEKENKFLREIGLDVKFGLSKNWTLDLSVNTDFAQVEADDQQVNLTRFSLFFPEKRLFFQERAGIFNFAFGGSSQLFYSRRIGLNEDSEPIRIYGGARTVGRVGLWDIGILSMQTADDEAFNGENLSVIRAKRQVINDLSDAGMIVTNRMDYKGAYNTNLGVDATINLFLRDYLDVKMASTLSDVNDVNRPFSLRNSRFWVALFSRRQRGFTYGTSFSRAGEDYNPGLGFDPRENYTRLGNRTQYIWIASPESRIFSQSIFHRGAIFWDNSTGDIQSLNTSIAYSLATKNGIGFQVGFRPNIENILESFDITDEASIPIGRYTFNNIEIQGNTPTTQPLAIFSNITIGDFYDGNRISASLDPTYNVSASLELGGTYSYNKISFDDRGQSSTIHLGRVKALYMYSTQISLASLIQYNSQSKRFSGNIRLRYNPREGNDLYIVYNDDINTELMLESPTLPRRNQNNLVIKYTYTFNL